MVKGYIPESSYKVANLFRRILVPVDGSAISNKAVNISIDFAQRYGSRLTFLFVCSSDKDEEKADQVLEQIKNKAEEAGIKADYKKVKIDTTVNSIATQIVKEAREGLFSAIILGAKGGTDYEEATIGSVALTVTVLAPCTVLVVR